MTEIFRGSLDFGLVWAVRQGDAWVVRGVDGQILQHLYQDAPTTGLPNVVAHRFVRDWIPCSLGIAEHHPRIWRGRPSPRRDHYEREWASSYGAVSSLVRRMMEVFRYVEPEQRNAGAYGHEIRQLLIVAATEVESSCRAVLAANGYGHDVDRLGTRDFVRLCAPMRLREWRVALDAHPGLGEIAPFATWDVERPTASLPWYDAYNAAKHDRELNFARATLLNAVSAVAATYIMVLAQFGEFDNRHFLGLDEFRQVGTPNFTVAESYIPPPVGGMGADAWIPRPIPL